jgi:hypothetical protein
MLMAQSPCYGLPYSIARWEDRIGRAQPGEDVMQSSTAGFDRLMFSAERRTERQSA